MYQEWESVFAYDDMCVAAQTMYRLGVPITLSIRFATSVA